MNGSLPLKILAVVGLLFLATTAHAANQMPASRLATLAHGINITRWFTNPHAPGFYGHYVSPEIVHQIKDAGFTYIRVPLAPGVFQAADGT
jgi:aryl-phospho-beta-D-glucosidase BglC (GH1 family)